MKSLVEYCRERRKAERRAFLKVLRAVPEDRRDYRPDPRSRSAAELAWVMASEEADILQVMESGSFEYRETAPPATMAEIVAAYERNAARVDERLAGMDEAAWSKKGAMLVGGKPVWEDATGEMVWGFLFDAIHHRGQLSAYLRPMGAKVPAIYGPSADDSGQ